MTKRRNIMLVNGDGVACENTRRLISEGDFVQENRRTRKEMAADLKLEASSSLNLSEKKAKRYNSPARESQKIATKDRFIDAAVTLFHRVGYQQATIDEIVRMAGTSRPTFYLYFKDKADLANHIGYRIGPIAFAIYRQLDEIETPSLKDVRRWLNAMVAHRREYCASIEAATEANTVDPQLSQNYVTFQSAYFYEFMPRYLSRFSGKSREDAHGKLMLLHIQLDRLLYLTEAKGVVFPHKDILDITAEIWWQTLFKDLKKNQVSSSRNTNSILRTAPKKAEPKTPK
jgi:AcrR family transcriptional regulator